MLSYSTRSSMIDMSVSVSALGDYGRISFASRLSTWAQQFYPHLPRFFFVLRQIAFITPTYLGKRPLGRNIAIRRRRRMKCKSARCCDLLQQFLKLPSRFASNEKFYKFSIGARIWSLYLSYISYRSNFSLAGEPQNSFMQMIKAEN